MSSTVKSLFAATITMFSLVNLTACGGGTDKKTEEVVGEDVSGYAEASCLYKYQEGPRAGRSGPKDIQNTYFKKNIDMNLLRPVLGASGAEVVRFAEATQVRFYSTRSDKSGTCDFLGELPAAPSDVQEFFNRADKNGTVLGLYVGLNSENLQSTKQAAAITIKKDGSKWVLVHEYMHHLFNIQSLDDGIDGATVKDVVIQAEKDYTTASELLKIMPAANNSSYVKETAVKLNKFNAAIFVFLQQYFLEEMTIESTLAEKVKSGELSLIHPKQGINGAAYTVSSSGKANAILKTVQTETKDFIRDHGSKIDSADLLLLKANLDEVESMQTQMFSLVVRASLFLREHNIDYTGLATQKQNNPHAGCSHGQIPEDLLAVIGRMGKKSQSR